jgi:hypothetical protein
VEEAPQETEQPASGAGTLDEEAEEASVEPSDEAHGPEAEAEEPAPAPAEEVLEELEPAVTGTEPPLEERAEAQPSAEPDQEPEPDKPSVALPYEEHEATKKKRPKKRLVYDERLGEVVARKVRKPKRNRQDWEEDVTGWKGKGDEIQDDTASDEDGGPEEG